MNRFCIIWLLLLNVSITFSQLAPGKYWIQFTDKENNTYSLDNPEEFLSERALLRRSKQNISLTSQDLPVSTVYIDSLEALGVTILNSSKWFNGAIIESTDTLLLDTLYKLGFIANNPFLQYKSGTDFEKKDQTKKYSDDYDSVTFYGKSWNQVEMINGQYLHKQGYLGDEIIIAITDAGFFYADEVPLLQHLWDNNRILVHRDFVDKNTIPFTAHAHGMMVLGACGGYLENVFIGTAPNAQYLLLRSEDNGSEYIIEEYNWVCAAEFADSMGADIINTSLGYSDFWDVSQDHSFSDMDGKTTPITRGSNIAASKGMLVVTSAGNEGNHPWYYITAPADADSIITVGAVDSTGRIAGFSSRGPTSDNRLKPNVCAKGENVFVQWIDGTLTLNRGTSYASPLIAGMAACLWQANPQATNMEIKQAIERSCDRYLYPDFEYGYGIPDFELADKLIKEWYTTDTLSGNVIVYPNPASTYVFIQICQPSPDTEEQITVKIRKLNGHLVQTVNLKSYTNTYFINLNNIQGITNGIYILEIITKNNSFTKKVML